MFKGVFISVFALIFSGCTGSPVMHSTMSEKQLQEQPSWRLCNAYHELGLDSAKRELVRREALNEHEWTLVEGGAIAVGMSELALTCSWGVPGTYGSINKSVGSWGERKQVVYRDCQSCQARYVYIRNGLITSWQN